MGSSRTRARTCVPCIGRWILYHCVTREVLSCYFWPTRPYLSLSISHLLLQPLSLCSLCPRFCVLFVPHTCQTCSVLGFVTCTAPSAWKATHSFTALFLLFIQVSVPGHRLREVFPTPGTSVPFPGSQALCLLSSPWMYYKQTVYWSVILPAPSWLASWEPGFCLSSPCCCPWTSTSIWHLEGNLMNLVWMNDWMSSFCTVNHNECEMMQENEDSQ